MKTVIHFIKNEIVFVIALLLAIISSFIITPSKEYISYIDFRTLALLLALMLVVQGLKSCGLFDALVDKLLTYIKTKRQLAFMLVSLCFFTSMLITNDVALITFVPFSVIILYHLNDSKYSIYLIVLETVAANLGSMFTPIGNPQNLYLYSVSGTSLFDFLRLMLPYTAVSYLLLLVAIFIIKPDKIQSTSKVTDNDGLNKIQLIVYIILFFVCIATVLSILDYRIMLGIILLTIILVNHKLIYRADYILLLTFVAFFIFIGNMKNIPEVSNLLEKIITGRECMVSILSSQVVSNVPAAMLLSGFTTNYDLLIIGTNIGGLGTIIASMASLISFKFYVKTEKSSTGKYMVTFTVVNLIFLAVLVLLHIIL